MLQIPQEIKVAIPLLVVAAGDKCLECDSVMMSLCFEPFEVECKNFHELIDLCQRIGVDVPTSLLIHPILCKTVSDLIGLSNILSEDKYHFFMRCFSTLVFVDNSLNNDIKKIQAQFLKFPGVYQDTCSFVIFKASESLIEFHSEKTCLCFETFSDSVAISCIKDFLARTSATSACRLLEFDDGEEVQISALKQTMLKVDFAGVSNDVKGAVKMLKKAFHDADPKDSDGVASCFEKLGMLEERQPGLAKKYKLIPSGNPPPSFSNMTGLTSDEYSLSLNAYLYAAGYYNKAGYFDQVVDCGIRIILDGHHSMIHPVLTFIIANSGYENMILKAWNLIHLVQNLGMRRQAALVASQLAEAFTHEEAGSSFRMYALNMMLKKSEAAGLLQIRNLCIPMFMSLLASAVEVPNDVLAKFMSKIMSSIGPQLPPEQQSDLFAELGKVNALEIKLPITVQKFEVQKLPYDIIKSEESGGNSRGVFLYSYLSDKKKQNNEPISVPVSQHVTITVEIVNPFAITLKADRIRAITTDESVTSKLSSEFFKPHSTCVIHVHVIPSKITNFSITGIEMFFFGARQVIMLENQIDLTVVDNVPRYHLRTDLPLSSELQLYDGELHEFNMWITNSGDLPITDIKVNFQQPDQTRMLQEPELPLLPSNQVAIKCCLLGDKAEDMIGMTLVTSCDGSNYCCSQLIRQRVAISDALSIRRIFMMNQQPAQEISLAEEKNVITQTDQIFVAYEVENLSNCTFSYNANVSNTKMTGLIGEHESLLMVTAYTLSELRCDGSDAQKSRVIALSKFMEEKSGTNLTREERTKIAKCVSIMQRLEAKWNFDWWVSSTRRGKLVRRAATIDDDLYNGIESRQIHPNISWKCGDEECCANSMSIDKPYRLVANFDSDLIKSCDLRLIDYDQQKSVIWEGQLEQRNDHGTNTYQFILCFGDPDVYKMKLSYQSVDGISGYALLVVRAHE